MEQRTILRATATDHIRLPIDIDCSQLVARRKTFIQIHPGSSKTCLRLSGGSRGAADLRQMGCNFRVIHDFERLIFTDDGNGRILNQKRFYARMLRLT